MSGISNSCVSQNKVRLVSGLPGAFYSIRFMHFATAQSPPSNCQQPPFWILLHSVRRDTCKFLTANISCEYIIIDSI